MGPLLIKGLIITGGVGISSLGAWGAYELFKPRTIQEKLEWQGERFPTMDLEGDLRKWKKLFDENSKATDGKIENMDSVTDSNGDNAQAKKMREECKKLMDKPIREASEDDYKKVKRCVISSIPGGEGNQ